MRKVGIICLLFCFTISFSQEDSEPTTYFDAQVFKGNIIKHADYVSHLISGHPDGFLLSYNWKTSGEKEWHQAYNYPEYGVSYHYVDFKNHNLGVSHALGIHYNFFFFNRNLLFRVSQGIGITSNPYDKETNNKNNALGSKLLGNSYLLLQYQNENIIDRIGLQAGLMITHFSNARVKAPNSGVNVLALNFGINYNLEDKHEFEKDTLRSKTTFKEHIKYNVAFRTGISEGPFPQLGQRQFYHIGLYADKRIGRKSALQAGTDFFFSRYLIDYIAYVSVAYPEGHKSYTKPGTDYRRIGLFVGHELFINKLSVETQLGYYIYKPFDYEMDFYQRIGLKYYLYPKLFVGLGLKTHASRAEAAEVSIGLRL